MESKVLVIFGTRPEAIKMAPLVMGLEASERLQVVTCATAQHRGLLDQVLGFFDLEPNYDLNLMKANQGLSEVTTRCLEGMERVLDEVKPQMIAVQGDTTTTFAAALAGFYKKIPICHIEAGLRTWDKYSPFPEEMNRKMTTALVDLHFAPTEEAADNLREEGIEDDTIFVTGNTSIDALTWAASRNIYHQNLADLYRGKKMVLLTAHRRENFGRPLEQIFSAIRAFAKERPDIHTIYPVHPNPNVQSAAHHYLSDLQNLSLISPVGYSELIFLLKECEFVLTDSGGLQEEAPALGKPIVVLRESTERPEAVSAGCAKLVGHNPRKIIEVARQLSDRNSVLYQSMHNAGSPYGDGTAAAKIVATLEARLQPGYTRRVREKSHRIGAEWENQPALGFLNTIH